MKFILRLSWLIACVPSLVRAEPAAESPASVRIAGIVVRWIRTDKAANCQRVETLVREAAAHGAKIVCTTECFLDGYAISDKSIPLDAYRALGEPIPTGTYFRRLSALARELQIHLIAGMLEADGEARFNTAVLLGPDGQLIGRYHKQNLGHEIPRNTAGQDSPVFATPYGRVGVMICADRQKPELVQRFCTAGADFVVCPSGGMFGPTKNDPIVQARSRENGIHIVFVHPVEFLVTAPDGSNLAQTIMGTQLDGSNSANGDLLAIPPSEVGGDRDWQKVFYVDLPLRRKSS